MHSRSITPAQRRKLSKIVDQVKPMTEADSLFFRRHLQRQHRVRLASQAEIEEQRILDNLPQIPDDWRVFIAVKQIAPGVRVRAILGAPEGAETDLPESLAAQIFRKAAQV